MTELDLEFGISFLFTFISGGHSKGVGTITFRHSHFRNRFVTWSILTLIHTMLNFFIQFFCH